MSHLFLSLPSFLLPLSCWQDLIKAKVVLNLLCRDWACTSDSPFLPPECWILSVCHHVQLALVFKTGPKHHFSSDFAELLLLRVHHSYCAWEVGWDFRRVPWVSNKCLLLCRLLVQGWTLAFLLEVCSLGLCHVKSAFMVILSPPPVSLSPEMLKSF